MANKGQTLVRLTKSDKEDIIRMIGEGKDYKIIADYIGCSYCTISYYARKNGTQKWSRSSGEKVMEVMKLHSDHPVTEIAKITGLSVRLVCGIIARSDEYKKEK
ncbi:MAG: hypothetical protein MJZ26_08975 [Fibrobacter sp.]|nr:hypothetical protein [Fibrobacter sp.]